MLTALYDHFASGCVDVKITASGVPDCDSAVLIDPLGEFVFLYRPAQSAGPVAVYSIQQWNDVGEGDSEEQEHDQLLDQLQPGYKAAWAEARVAEAELFDARKAIEVAPKRPLKAVPTT